MLPAPNDDEAMRWLARAAHVRPDGQHDALGVLRDELKRQNVRVSRLHAKLFYQPLLESAGVAVELTEGMSAEAAERQLAALGYQSPQSALTHLAALANQNGRRGRVQAVLLPTLLDWLSDTPDPDAGLLQLHPLDADHITSELIEHEPKTQGELDRRLAAWWAARRRPPDAWRTLDDATPSKREYLHRWRAGQHTEALAVIAGAANFLARTGDGPLVTKAVREADLVLAPDERLGKLGGGLVAGVDTRAARGNSGAPAGIHQRASYTIGEGKDAVLGEAAADPRRSPVHRRDRVQAARKCN